MIQLDIQVQYRTVPEKKPGRTRYHVGPEMYIQCSLVKNNVSNVTKYVPYSRCSGIVAPNR